MMRYITPEMIVRKRFEGQAPPEWSAAVLSFRSRLDAGPLLRELGAEPLGRKIVWGMRESDEWPLAHEMMIGSQRVGVIAGCEWGGPHAAILVEELACLGVKHLIGVGLAGSIDRDLPRGTLVYASSALTTDGTSSAYTDKEAVSCSENLCTAACNAARRTGAEIRPVCIATVDAIYRETDTAVAAWAARGAQAINMETTPFYAASEVCGASSIWIGRISDRLVGDEWEAWESQENVEPIIARMAKELVGDIVGA